MISHYRDMNMENYLQGKTALITGGFAGIGLAITRALALRGAAIAVGARTVNQMPIDELGLSNASTFTQSVDVRSSKNIDAFVAQAQAQLGPIDILVNAAGISTSQTVTGHSDKVWNDIIETNLSGPFKLTRACLPGMIERNWGRIINIGSTAARVATKDSPAYCASKSGLLGLTRAVALEGAPHGVTCMMISPTWVDTEMMQRSMQRRADKNNSTVEQEYEETAAQTPQNRLVQPSEIGALAAFLCRDEAIGITMEDIQVNAGAFW